MTWIFAEDFEGVKGESMAVNIAIASYICVYGDCINFASTGTSWDFTTPEQAKAAYEKIKGMLKAIDDSKRMMSYWPAPHIGLER